MRRHTGTLVIAACLLGAGSAIAQESDPAPTGISGVTVDLAGDPVDSVHLTLRTEGGETVNGTWSAGGGTFILPVPRDGAYRIHADISGYLPTVSHLFELRSGGRYQIDVEMTRVAPETLARNTPRVLLEEWVARYVPDRRTRDIRIVDGEEWRDAAVGRDLYETLDFLELPRVSLRRTADAFCMLSASSTRCMSVGIMANGPQPRLRDLTPDRVDALVYFGPGVYSAPDRTEMRWNEAVRNASVVLFIDGYLIAR